MVHGFFDELLKSLRPHTCRSLTLNNFLFFLVAGNANVGKVIVIVFLDNTKTFSHVVLERLLLKAKSCALVHLLHLW